MRVLFVILRLVGAGLGIAAIVGQLITSLGYWGTQGVTDFTPPLINFFSFFTIESNVGSVAVFLVGAGVLMAGRSDSHGFSVFRACVTSYMAVTGIVYNTLLRGIELPQGATLEWSNELLHVVLPVLIVVDWLFAPGRRKLGWADLWWVVAFPVVWAVYTLIRGPFTYDTVLRKQTWYPYPFLDPANSPEGYVSVAFYVVLIAAVIGGVGAAVIAISRRWASATEAAPSRSAR